MNIEDIRKEILNFMNNSGLNRVSEEVAFTPDLVDMEMYEDIIIGVCKADDEYLKLLANDKKLEERKSFSQLELPDYWLEDAKSIISVFFRFSERVRVSNRGGDEPSREWLHARIQGQEFLNALSKHIETVMTENGSPTIAPTLDKKHKVIGIEDKNAPSGLRLASNWSERHVAFATGIGTFSLSDSFISEIGAAGRLTSFITTMEFPPEIYNDKEHTPDNIYDNCNMCGVCVKNCPVNAITLEKGHDHKPCSDLLDRIEEKNPPYYGCGKCQTKAPCETQIPKARAK